MRVSSLSPVKNEYFVDENLSLAPPQNHRALSSVETNRRSPVQLQDKPVKELKISDASRKRSASPLDLSGKHLFADETISNLSVKICDL